ncbi:hypothetical protein Htur_5282 (plasmid) [Haloterrigena turkmenica DSM 5511]|uniref:Uncharacterized protein n=1 Tax=Haloterrigena turkmenica (strain ATCC 51198 / DSM 5511 / JCM 9101 / NCIMB 13204 / VKM B-1734 / 4k) TaxID=543526 RepID=D2S3R2_HALTV|nr:hypothetical protein [Haloterrigena turkmenica]ADB64009.1 hypothetical protein Htur_5282 [Haloterrigena turkmenica DSM 5511]
MTEHSDTPPLGLAILSFASIGIVLASIAGKLFNSSQRYLGPTEPAHATASPELWKWVFTLGLPIAAVIVLWLWLGSGTRR